MRVLYAVAIKWLRFFAVVGGIAFSLQASPVSADSFDAWMKQTTDKGCILFVHDVTYADAESYPDHEGYVWTGPCERGQRINGEGTLYIQFGSHKGGGGFIISWTGQITNGFPNGRMTVRKYDVADDGKWDPNAGYVTWDDKTFKMGCGNDPYCKPGLVENPQIIKPVSPAYFPLPSAKKEVPAFFSIGGSPKAPIVPAGSLATKRVRTPLPGGAALLGSSNLDCLVFKPGTGPDARSALVNQCGEEVRVNYCLRYKAGQDNCWPMATNWEATLWPIRAGGSLTMPAADTLTLWSVFGCRAPLFPLQAKFRNGMLTDGYCFEDNLAPPTISPSETPRVVRSNNPSSWPPGWANKHCIHQSPQLMPGLSVYLRHDCGSDQNVYYCVVNNGSRLSAPLCTNGSIYPANSSSFPTGGVLILGPPNSYKSFAVFACDAPLVPKDVSFDGSKLSGSCEAD